jgi:sodium-dependent lysophosphatidylcholine symporter 1
VPYTSLTMVLTTSQRVRDSATSFRMGMEVFGVLLAAGIQGIMLAFYDKKGNCPNQTLPVNYTDYYTFRDDKNTTNSNSTGYSKLGEGYLLSAGIMALIYFICCLFTFFGCKEIKDVVVDKNTHFFRSIKKVFKHRSYLSLLFIFLLSSLAIQLVQSNLALFCRYSVDAKNQYQWIIIALLGTTVISLPVWQLIMLKIGKKLTYGIGLSVIKKKT